MARNSAYNSLVRKTLRRSRRLKLDIGGRAISIPVMHVPTGISPEMFVSSAFNLLHASAFQKEVLNEASKLRKRIIKLQAEGYRFPDYIWDLAFGEEIVVSRKTLNKLKQMDMYYLRSHAKSYKGETDINKIIDMHNKEVAAKRAATRAKKAAEKGGVNKPEPIKPEDVPDEGEVLKDKIVEQEKQYIGRVLQFVGATDEDRINYAIERAQSVLNMIYGATLDEMKAIIDFIDKNGKLYDVINAAETEFEGLFYDAPKYNMDILGITPFGGENLFQHIFGDDAEFMPSSFYDFRNEVEDEDDFDDVPF